MKRLLPLRSDAVVCALLFASTMSIFAQGALTPPGAPGPTMKTLTQVEPRTDVATLSGDSGDSFIISQSGSYYLTGNITGVSAKNGISIQASNVTVDLNGFTMTGTGGGSVAGITIPSTQTNVVIRNGVLPNWGQAGVSASNATNCLFEHLIISNVIGANGSAVGISVGTGSTVSNCTVENSNSLSIQVANSCAITGCSVVNTPVNQFPSGLNGLASGTDCMVTNCIVKDVSFTASHLAIAARCKAAQSMEMHYLEVMAFWWVAIVWSWAITSAATVVLIMVTVVRGSQSRVAAIASSPIRSATIFLMVSSSLRLNVGNVIIRNNAGGNGVKTTATPVATTITGHSAIPVRATNPLTNFQ